MRFSFLLAVGLAALFFSCVFANVELLGGSGGGGVLGGVLGGGAKADANGKADGEASSLGLNGLTSGLLGSSGLTSGLLGGSGAGGLLGGVLGGGKGGDGAKKGALGLSGLTSGLLGGSGAGSLLGGVLGGGGKTADGKTQAGLGGLTSGLLNGGATKIVGGTLGGVLGGGKAGADGKKAGSLGLNGLTSGLLGGSGGSLLGGVLGGSGKSTGGKSSSLGLNGLTSGLLGGSSGGLLGGLLGGGAKAKAEAEVESKFDVNVESEPEVTVRGASAFKFYVKNLFEYQAGAKAGLQLDGDDTIFKIYGKGLNVGGVLKTSAAWKFNELVDAKAEGHTELLATTLDGAVGAVFTVQPASTEKADETFTFELLLDTAKLREQGWFKRESTTVAVEAVLRSYMKAQICDTDAVSATACLTDAESVVQGLLRWNNKIVCQAGTSAQIVGLAINERQSSIGYTEAALTWDVRGLAEASGICVLEAAVQAK